VKSIRYKGPLTKAAIGLFVVAFFVLGYLGIQPVTTGRTIAAQIGTAVYFLFFLLMPWWSKMDKCRPEPRRVTGK
jgi:ubiquinol-cytochrome c reductase cytochrome b subunit